MQATHEPAHTPFQERIGLWAFGDWRPYMTNGWERRPAVNPYAHALTRAKHFNKAGAEAENNYWEDLTCENSTRVYQVMLDYRSAFDACTWGTR